MQACLIALRIPWSPSIQAARLHFVSHEAGPYLHHRSCFLMLALGACVRGARSFYPWPGGGAGEPSPEPSPALGVHPILTLILQGLAHTGARPCSDRRIRALVLASWFWL